MPHAPLNPLIIIPSECTPYHMTSFLSLAFPAPPCRFYIMRLPKRGGRFFHRITYHAAVTQCLGSLAPTDDWYMAVARPSGSVGNYPRLPDLALFRVPHGLFIKLEPGTWHAGPLFWTSETMDFCNLVRLGF